MFLTLRYPSLNLNCVFWAADSPARWPSICYVVESNITVAATALADCASYNLAELAI